MRLPNEAKEFFQKLREYDAHVYGFLTEMQKPRFLLQDAASQSDRWRRWRAESDQLSDAVWSAWGTLTAHMGTPEREKKDGFQQIRSVLKLAKRSVLCRTLVVTQTANVLRHAKKRI